MNPSTVSQRIIFGCGNFGGLGSAPHLRDKGDDTSKALALLDQARALGLTQFDTANTYGGGVSEEVLGEWLSAQGAGFRNIVKIATKVGNPNGCPHGERPLSRTQIAHHLDQSLKRLRLDRVDLYYVHEFDRTTPLEETLEAMTQALAQGKIAAFGVSNASLQDLKAVLALTSGALRAAFTHVQNQFNLLEQSDLADVIPLSHAEDLAYVAFSPLAGGLLTGKYQEGRPAAKGTRIDDAPEIYEHLWAPSTFRTIEDLRRRAQDLGTSVPSAALRFILETPGVAALIIAPRSSHQFENYALQALL